jgi:murein DD-endopeptidase MepM/ murein hydrolase activator NlpD
MKSSNFIIFKFYAYFCTGLLLGQLGCAHAPLNTYETATPAIIKKFKHVRIPFVSGTNFMVSQGAFGSDAHDQAGNEYNWDFEAPYGTPVVSIEDGVVLEVWEPAGDSGCNPDFCDSAHNIKVQHRDGTVAQYVHIKSRVQMGEHVKKGKIIAVTYKNGCICQPHLQFGLYRSDKELYNSPDRHTIPLAFDGIEGQLLKAKQQYKAP